MQPKPLKPRKAINKAFLKIKPNRTEIERFKTNLIELLDRTNNTESEEFHKNLVSDFLKRTYYEPNHFINTKGRNDLVIHNGNKAKSNVGVIIEAKKPTNRGEMVTREKLNVKAFQELMLYYLRERITHKNLEVKYMVATNINEWFIFDSNTFEKLFAQNKALVKQFNDFEGGRLAGKTTDFFYREIAEPFINTLTQEIEFTFFDIREYEKPLRNNNPKDDTILIALFKLLSPEHLLKLPFANDSNSLDKRFYGELLHIIGLAETKEGSKKLIARNKPGQRNTGAILENAIIQLDSLDKINRLDNPQHFGATQDERLFNVGLELAITWVNRILFLKLLEAQLGSYHKGDKNYEFLSIGKIGSYDDLNSLFFQVLARKHSERNEDVKDVFAKVPYLNSSLFEPTGIEHGTLFISNLRDDKTLPIYSATVLKTDNGKKRTGSLSTLEYLFEFLNAYDFSSEGSEEIQEDNKTLINASVLGLIFEKINGYKDGSFFTPGFITMYMCRETIRKAVVQKFNEASPSSSPQGGERPLFKTLEDIYDQIDDNRMFTRQQANDLINSLKICDPAVGSGHFLVSALNEMIAIKNDLKILQDRDGKRLKEYHFEVVNDELIVTDEDGELFEYNPTNKESHRIQQALFHEKQTLIENCLFGVDINPNSVKICRLRLWIELLKNAYYKNETELETLPNIDINIKRGNSLISRFALDADLKKALKSSKWTIDSYRIAVDTYRNAENKEQKRAMEKLIADIKSDFRSEISLNDPKIKRLNKLKGELFGMTNQTQMFEMGKKEKAAWNKKLQKLGEDTSKLEAEIEEIKNNKIYEDAFEWRFEFPEVLDDTGDFVGFDVVIGNPPYIRQEELQEIKPYLKSNYKTFAGTADLYVYFVELGLSLNKSYGEFIFILPNKWMRAGYGKNLRSYLQNLNIEKVVDFGDLQVFEEATTYPCILQIEKGTNKNFFESYIVEKLLFENGLQNYLRDRVNKVDRQLLNEDGWILAGLKKQVLLEKIKKSGITLSKYVDKKIYRGVLTGYNKAFVINKEIRQKLIDEDASSIEIIKPFLAGKDIKKYGQPESENYLIFTRRGININDYPAILNHLNLFKERLMPKPKNYQGKKWSGRKPGAYKWFEIQDAVDYYKEFEKPKILWPGISSEINAFAFDEKSYYGNDNNQLIITSDMSLLGILNSKLVKFYISSIADFVRGGFIRLKISYVMNVPIPEGCNEIKNEIKTLVSEFRKNGNTDLLIQIDQLVYQLYDLTEEEIGIVEEATS